MYDNKKQQNKLKLDILKIPLNNTEGTFKVIKK